MIKIGDFAKICNTSARTLRYYDDAGVLKADFVDEASGYRFYSPDAVEKYKKLVFYKELGFSLQEIKKLLAATEEEEKKMLKKKKETLLSSVEQIQGQVQTIDGMVVGERDKASVFEILNLPFEDDPEVVGKWELCGMLRDEEDLNSVVKLPPRTIFQELIFLPGGAPVWMYFWTKGILYTLSHKYSFSTPNPYKTFRKDGEHYMVIRFVAEDRPTVLEDAFPILYRQVDTIAYSEGQTRPRVDKIDYPFVEDPAVSGAWRVVDFVECAEDFHPAKRFTAPKNLATTDINFLPRGMCVKTVRSSKTGRKANQIINYTKGLVINRSSLTAEKYIIKTFDGKDYLLVQHKSGDYSYGGYEPCWYVFERKGKPV